MSYCKVLMSAMLAIAASQTAFASSAIPPIGGEVGYVPVHSTSSTKSRIEVKQELSARRSPNQAASDGVMFVGGEVGYLSPTHAYQFEGGKLIHSDAMQHNSPKPDWRMSATERREFSEYYVN